MKYAQITGLSFGLTSGVITTLGLMMGLYASTSLKSVVIGGILAIAVADSFSDALGIHISEESKKSQTGKNIWETTISTFLFKLFFTMTFIVPVLIFPLPTAIILSIFWGMLLLGILSFRIAISRKESPISVISEHLTISVLVIVATHYIGKWVSSVFG